MRRLLAVSTRSVVVGLLAVLALGAGCAKPSAPAEQFVGTWIAPLPGKGELRPGASPTLTLAADGTGLFTQYPDPHTQNVSWVLRGDKLLLADRDGSGSTTYRYRFKGRDELVLIMEAGEVSLKRYTGAKGRGAGAGAPKPASGHPSAERAPTRGGSARPPARSRQ